MKYRKLPRACTVIREYVADEIPEVACGISTVLLVYLITWKLGNWTLIKVLGITRSQFQEKF